MSAPPTAGLCPHCRHHREVRGARSTFLICALAQTNPAYQRYPRQPVLACAGYEDSGEAEARIDGE